MKNPFKKATVRKSPTVAQTENYYIECPIQARKTLRHFGNRFNIKLYNDYLKATV
jgi:hypothetical protein